MVAKKLLGAAALLAAGYAALPLLLDVPVVQRMAAGALRARLGDTASVARIELGRDLTLRLRGVAAAALPGVRIGTVELPPSRWLLPSLRSAAWAADDSWTAIELTDDGARLRDLSGAIGDVTWTVRLATAHGKLERRGNAWRAALRWSAAALAAHDSSFRYAVDAVDLRGDLSAEVDATGNGEAAVTAQAWRGDALWNRLYADLSLYPVRAAGRLRLDGGRYVLEAGEVSVAGVGTLRGDAVVESSGAARGRVSAAVDGLARLYDLVVRQAFGERHPRLADTWLRGALRAEADVAVDADRRWVATGELHLREVTASGFDPSFLLTGVEMDLPLLLGDGDVPAAPRRGVLRGRSLQIGGIAVALPEIELVAEPNRVRSRGEIRLPVLDGTALISDLRADDLASSERRAGAALRLDGVRLENLAGDLGWPGLRGSLDGTLTSVQLSADDLSSEGEIVAHVFDGVVRARRPGVEQLRSSVPEIHMDVDFEDLSLSRLTDVVTFGRMSGVIRGSVRDLVVVNLEPVAFRARVETVPRPGVPQTISVDAVRQLSILGGSSGDPISRGVMSFFDEYRYAEMGLRCSLHNDLFELRGVRSDGKREYLVVAALVPPRISVISHSQRISFSEMVKRLRQAAAVVGEKDEAGG